MAKHHFKDAADGAKSKGHCSVHDRDCDIDVEPEDIYISGPTCQLYSDLNNERATDFNAIKEHEDFSAVKSFVQTLSYRRPRIAMGKRRHGKRSPSLMRSSPW